MSPRDIEIIVSRFFREDNVKEQSNRDDLITGYMEINLGVTTMQVELCGDTDELVANQKQISESELCNEEKKRDFAACGNFQKKRERAKKRAKACSGRCYLKNTKWFKRFFILRWEIAFQQRNEKCSFECVHEEMRQMLHRNQFLMMSLCAKSNNKKKTRKTF
uniref:Uncharacterized protein n=1 Tax=Proboscia inermis TaxID=420281 RepID=A0A7S0GIS8_9STRA|mmetsp:Transcript_6625/g.6791  ORF Transcript_6625/g.6791 Transcript_6625/m.6791 type:complete len:163 (+) Transcript_6625:360-848(+)